MPPDFAAEGLLDGLEGDARAARERLLARLHEDGVPLAELKAAVAEDRLILIPAERFVGGPARYTGLELAERSGMDPEFLIALRRAQGLPVPEPDQPAYSENDLDTVRMAKQIRDEGIPPEDMLTITRVLGRGLSQAAELMRIATLDLVLEPGTPEDELALRYADAASRLQPLVGPLVGQMLTLHLRHIVRGEVVTATEREAGGFPGAREVAIAFADLVGFTRIGEEVAPDELGRVAGRLETLTHDRLRGGVRLVKTLGDAVMLVSPDPGELLDMTLDLVAAADAEGEAFPQLRAGVALGPALARAGDWYGAPVNLASRVTDRARPGTVLATKELRDTVGEDRIRWSFAGEKRLKGIRDPVPLFRARPESSTDA